MPASQPPKRRSRVSKIKLFFQILPILIVAVVGVVGALQIDQVREFLSNASGEPANIQVDPTLGFGPVRTPWKNLAQGGEMSMWIMDPIRAKVAALEPEYIRIDHIYSFYDVVQMQDGQVKYDFSKLDIVVDGILSTGAKPYIALSYVPIQLSDDGTITGKPKDWNQWQDLIRATIQHYSGTKGINDVIYEVWNEPDLFGGWKTYGDKNYLELYTYAHRGQAQVRNAKPYTFGGPGITALYRNWFTRLVEHAEQNNLRLDFFSWHRYNMSLDVFQADIDQARAWRNEYPQWSDLELHVTEFGHDSKNHPGYDGNLGAAHTVAALIQYADGVDRAFAFEIEDGKDPAGQERWGRWGVLTNREFGANIKPRYQALRLMNRLQGDQVQLLGEGTWVKALATRNGPVIEMILANYDSRGTNAETVPVLFQKVGPGNFTLEITQINGSTRRVPLVSEGQDLGTTIAMSANSVLYVRLVPDEGVVPAFVNMAQQSGDSLETSAPEQMVESATPTPEPATIFQLEFDVATPVGSESGEVVTSDDSDTRPF